MVLFLFYSFQITLLDTSMGSTGSGGFSLFLVSCSDFILTRTFIVWWSDNIRMSVKGIVQPKMNILSSFTHPQVVPNLCIFLLLNSKEDIFKNVGNPAGGYWLPWYYLLSMHVNGLCSTEERTPHRFGTASGWINDVRIYKTYFKWGVHYPS